MVEGMQSNSAMAQGGRNGITFEILVFLPISFFALSFFRPSFFFLGTEKEVRREWWMDRKDIGVRKGEC
jgi:hypothetical protein